MNSPRNNWKNLLLSGVAGFSVLASLQIQGCSNPVEKISGDVKRKEAAVATFQTLEYHDVDLELDFPSVFDEADSISDSTKQLDSLSASLQAPEKYGIVFTARFQGYNEAKDSAQFDGGLISTKYDTISGSVNGNINAFTIAPEDSGYLVADIPLRLDKNREQFIYALTAIRDGDTIMTENELKAFLKFVTIEDTLSLPSLPINIPTRYSVDSSTRAKIGQLLKGLEEE